MRYPFCQIRKEKIQLLNPDPDKEVPRIDKWKYELVKTAI